jgi:hypothetical protein
MTDTPNARPPVSSAGVVQLPPTNQAALRDRIAEALEHGPVRCPLSPCPVVMHTPDGARAHLTNAHPGPVLPAPVDRAAVYRDLADQQTQLAVADDLARRRDMAAARRQLVKGLRRMAAEAPATEERLSSVHARDIDGFCPACGHPTLRLGEDGRVTCTLMDCTKPEAAAALLHEAAVVLPAQPHNDETQQDGAQA